MDRSHNIGAITRAEESPLLLKQHNAMPEIFNMTAWIEIWGLLLTYDDKNDPSWRCMRNIWELLMFSNNFDTCGLVNMGGNLFPIYLVMRSRYNTDKYPNCSKEASDTTGKLRNRHTIAQQLGRYRFYFFNATYWFLFVATVVVYVTIGWHYNVVHI